MLGGKSRLLIILLFISYQLAGNNTNSSLYLKSQYAGNIGIISVGTGMQFNRIAADINYGYLPEKKESHSVWTIALKTSFIFSKHHILNRKTYSYAGLMTTYSITSNTYSQYPQYFPKSYYDFPNAIHFHCYLGSAIQTIALINNTEPYLFAEVGSADYAIISAIQNKYLKPTDILNFSFGIKVFLK